MVSKMERDKTLKENLEWLIRQYQKELDIEENKNIEEQDLDTIEHYKNIIIELEYAIKISKGVE